VHSESNGKVNVFR